MEKKIALVGRSAVGKNHMLRVLSDMGLCSVVGYTSRPPRPNEENGKDYNFVDQSTFDRMRENGEFLQSMDFGGYSYGTTIEEFEKCDAFITSPHGLENIPEGYRHRIKIVELTCGGFITNLRMKIDRPFLTQQEISKRRVKDDELFRGFDEKMKELGYEHVKVSTESIVEHAFNSGKLKMLEF